MATTTQDEGFHEIQLNGKQLVFFFMAATVVLVVSFLLGVFVGRGVERQSGNGDAVIAAQPAPPAAPAPTTTASDARPAGPEELTYPERLATAGSPRETLREPPPPAAAPPPATRPRVEPATTPPAIAASDVPAEPAGDGFSIQVTALGKREEAAAIVRRLADKGYPAYVMAPGAGAPSVFRVRVGKFKERGEADAVSARLQKEEQFKPWIVR